MSRICTLAALVAISLAACAQEAEHRSLDVTLETGPECIYQGPNTLTPGAISITYNNPMKVPTWVHFVKLDEGRSIDEFADRFETIPGGGLPGWSTLVWGFLVVDPETTMSGDVDIGEGRYGIVCGTVNPDRGFFAGGLTVKG